MHQVLQHLDRATAHHALAETLRVLRPGGVLYVLGNNRLDGLRGFSSAERQYQRNRFTPRELRDALLGAGFARVEARDEARPVLGRSAPGRLAATAALRLTRLERLSATANAMAFAPG